MALLVTMILSDLMVISAIGDALQHQYYLATLAYITLDADMGWVNPSVSSRWVGSGESGY